MKLVSWNVNGLRAVLRRNFLDYLAEENPDILCVQETKCQPEDLNVTWPRGYSAHFNSAKKRGYAGTAIITKATPLSVRSDMNKTIHDQEGRILTAEFHGFYLVNVYVPNAKRDLSRLPYRQGWDRDFLAFLKKLEQKMPVVVCGDFNVAHEERDLSNPRANVHNHGFTAEERAGFDNFINAGFLDTLREFDPSEGKYTWWSPMGGARSRNVGWRLDYFLISKALRPQLKTAFIRDRILGSDHCPVGIELRQRGKPTRQAQ